MKIKQSVFVSFIFFLSLSVISLPQSTNSYQKSGVQYPVSGIRDLNTKISNIIADPFFERTTIALDIYDLSENISLYKYNEKLLLHPASNMKILTSIAGLINLGKGYTFKTELYHSGIIKDEVLYGDLYIVGGFDPDFSIKDLDSLLRIVQSLGIKEIEGSICADISKKDSLYWGKGWMWDDDPSPDAPYLSALNINDNCIEVFVEGIEIGSPAKVTLIPQTDFVELINNTVTVSSELLNGFTITRDWVNKKNTIIVEGKVRKTEEIDTTAQTVKVNLLYPEKYFLTLLEEHLKQAGIICEKSFSIKRVEENSVFLVAINRSIDTVLSEINTDSDNLDAEMLLYAIAYADSGAPANAENGIQAINRLIDSLGLEPDNYYLADGSGVSHYNLLTAELTLEMLKYMYYKQKDLFDLFYNSLAVAGVDGTLKNRMKNTTAQNNVHAKTGTLNGVSNLSGYVTSKNGHLLAFSIMIQNFVGQSSEARIFQDKICELLAGYE